MLFIIDIKCGCGFKLTNVQFESYEEWVSEGFDCEQCGERCERDWNGKSASVRWACDCPTASGGR